MYHLPVVYEQHVLTKTIKSAIYLISEWYKLTSCDQLNYIESNRLGVGFSKESQATLSVTFENGTSRHACIDCIIQLVSKPLGAWQSLQHSSSDEIELRVKALEQ